MKNLGSVSKLPVLDGRGRKLYPNVAPEPAMYCPNVLMTPFDPAPYLKMFTVPAKISFARRNKQDQERKTDQR